MYAQNHIVIKDSIGIIADDSSSFDVTINRCVISFLDYRFLRHLQDNQLDGTIPPQLGNLTHIYSLYASPPQLGDSPRLHFS